MAALALASGGCGSINPASRIYGKWNIDLPATAEIWGNIRGNEQTKATAKAAAQSLGADAALDLRKDETGVLSGKAAFGADGGEGTWRVATVEGQQMQVEFRRKATPQEEQIWKDHPSKRPGPRKLDVKFVDDDTIEVNSAAWQSSVVFRRAK
jgi:hypothetical protein